MDSMRNLHRSLPRSNPRGRRRGPPKDLLQTFKQAALSVTNLYKSAVEELSLERQVGYQDAVYDLLSFLDKENIGLGDGEGWRIRQWATERQETGSGHNGVSEGEEEQEEDREGGSPIPEDEQPQAQPEMSPVRDAAPVSGQTETSSVRAASPSVAQSPRTEAFSFRSSHPYPEVDMQVTEMPIEQSQTTVVQHLRQATPRTPRRHAQTTTRIGNKQQRPLGAGAGTKRRLQFGDFFGLANLGEGKDNLGGGPKRPRPT